MSFGLLCRFLAAAVRVEPSTPGLEVGGGDTLHDSHMSLLICKAHAQTNPRGNWLTCTCMLRANPPCLVLCRYLGINASARASLYIYNTEAEVDIFIKELGAAIQFFKGAA